VYVRNTQLMLGFTVVIDIRFDICVGEGFICSLAAGNGRNAGTPNGRELAWVMRDLADAFGRE
jgi:hypothetical protein